MIQNNRFSLNKKKCPIQIAGWSKRERDRQSDLQVRECSTLNRLKYSETESGEGWLFAHPPPPLIGPEIEMKNFVIPVVCICFWTMFVHFPLLHHPQSRTTCLRVPVVAISLQFFAIFAMSLKKSKLCYDSTFFASIRFIFSNVNTFIFRLL